MREHTCNPSTWKEKEDFVSETILSHKARPYLKKGGGLETTSHKEVVYLSGYRGRGQGHVDHLCTTVQANL